MYCHQLILNKGRSETSIFTDLIDVLPKSIIKLLFKKTNSLFLFSTRHKHLLAMRQNSDWTLRAANDEVPVLDGASYIFHDVARKIN